MPSTDPRRSFNSAERVALYLAADGKCSRCGTDLKPGWHADHVDAWARGGPTDVINGQALCPQCNLKKGVGSMGVELRNWQQEALDRFLGRREDFLTVATPGAGKTTFAITAATKLITLGEVRRIIVVVPTAHLRSQWAASATRLGIQLDYRFSNAAAVIASDYDGVVVTYQTVATTPDLWRRLCSDPRNPTLVVFDEIHHAGDHEDQAWGVALKHAFEPAARRLLLSGTPFRTDQRPIPFVTYNGENRAVPSYNYDYGMALQDGSVVRPIVFPAMDGESKWKRAGEMTTTSVALADTDDKTVPPALRAALAAEGEWIPSVLKEADEALRKAREDTPDAGGLVIASDQQSAYAYQAILTKITGEEAAIAVSDNPEASQVIDNFSASTSRWIVAVQMVSEGVDILRLTVGVYASRIRTQLFFTQVVGRFVRLRGENDETCARLFIPSIEPLLSFAKDIEKTVDAVIAEEEEKIRDTQRESDEGGSGSTLFPEVEVVGSSAAVHHATIANGESITTAEKVYAEKVLSFAGSGLPRNITPEAVALILKVGGAMAPTPDPAQPEPSPKPLTKQKEDVRRVIRRKVGKLNVLTGRPHQHIHADMNRMFGGPITAATL
nr:DEAD/DEAH box helicase family protein [Nocardiopsis mwathae]